MKTETTYQAVIHYSVVSMLFAVFRVIFTFDKRSIKSHIIGAVVSIPVGILAAGVTESFGYGGFPAYTAASVASLLANDIVVGLLALGKQWREAPENFIGKK